MDGHRAARATGSLTESRLQATSPLHLIRSGFAVSCAEGPASTELIWIPLGTIVSARSAGTQGDDEGRLNGEKRCRYEESKTAEMATSGIEPLT